MKETARAFGTMLRNIEQMGAELICEWLDDHESCLFNEEAKMSFIPTCVMKGIKVQGRDEDAEYLLIAEDDDGKECTYELCDHACVPAQDLEFILQQIGLSDAADEEQ